MFLGVAFGISIWKMLLDILPSSVWWARMSNGRSREKWQCAVHVSGYLVEIVTILTFWTMYTQYIN